MLWMLAALAAPMDRPYEPELVLEAAGVTLQVRVVHAPTTTVLEVQRAGVWSLLVGSEYRADRVVLSADGQQAAFVSGLSGLASVYIVPTDGSAAPRPLTNVNLPKSRAGLVPPPSDNLRFDGAWLHWLDGRKQAHAVRWRPR